MPEIVERIHTSLINWWPATFGALRGNSKMVVTGAVMSAITATLLSYIARSSIDSRAKE
ncbi:hypothetical protein [Mycobacterium lepromatosis]|uniref:hypothetical protein n=1 Tax=Mycobacterium lepromatosis TaxID=480418 RepID=UPI001ED9BC77|nr:hypothetical protein [Mycobacterium lepromatosis]